MSGPMYRKVRIFVASPSDVSDERDRLRLVVDELNQSLADVLGVTLELLDWRTHVAPWMGRPEQVILDQLPVETWDIFVGLLWARFGKPSGGIDPETGKPFDSGSEEEFTLAYRLWEKKRKPEILFYRCKRLVSPIHIDTTQLTRVQQFFTGFAAGGPHQGLFQSYRTALDFERIVRRDLTNLLNRRYGRRRQDITSS